MSSANIASRLSEMARLRPQQLAIAAPQTSRWRRTTYRELTFAQLDAQSEAVAAGLLQHGLQPGMKLVLFVPFSIEFIVLTFALLKAGAVVVLIDPGMGRQNIFQCLAEVNPDGFVAIPSVHAVRWLLARKFRQARFNICVGPRLPGVTATYQQLLKTDSSNFRAADVQATDPAAIIFTSGSTGAPKGVLYEHGMFAAQVRLIQQQYGIEPGEIDLPGFPLFGLFNAAMGVSTVIPEMNPTKPAKVDPVKIARSIEAYHVTQAFGSPAFWNRVGRYCERHQLTFPGLRRTLSAGGPVPNHVLERMSRTLTKPGADLYTPYGATESLPVSSIGAREVLAQHAAATRRGAGTCVGRPFPEIEIRIIPITEGPIAALADVPILGSASATAPPQACPLVSNQVPPGREVGEIIVSGPSVTREYYQRPEATALAKIPDGDRFWHRTGDVGYIDEEGLLWFCGRKAHIVVVEGTRLDSVCCEAIFDQHPRIHRTALVGVGERPNQRPVIVAEPERGEFPKSVQAEKQLREELLQLGKQHPHTAAINDVVIHPGLPVDTRHNVKINREELKEWAEARVPL
ncbi:fatty acid CoA ligase family protein [Planctomicrobium sp. SH664]|uniref:fatty acid CoA ligase family protein n=1 Tax=Planctomicrobium sp. SH664 TaxID=3448125 RepID=UPI003F5C356F